MAKNKKYQAEVSDKMTRRDILEMVVFTVVLFVVFFLIRQFLFMPVAVDGPSMEPTLQHGDRLILNKVSDPDRFDVVVFPAPDGSDALYIKRIIGAPGDSLEYRDGILYVNGNQVYEPYLEELKALNPNWDEFIQDFSLADLTGESVVPEGHYFVLGDNRSNSKDSRSFGFITEEDLEGTANFRFFPFGKIGNVSDTENYPDIQQGQADHDGRFAGRVIEDEDLKLRVN